MNLTVLGAAGATGVQLVEQAIAAGHQVTALARSAENLTLTNPNLYVVQGDATDRSQAMKGANAVISVLGARGPVIAEATRAVVAAAEEAGPDRIVMLSSFAVARDRLKPVSKLVTRMAMGSQIKDKTAGEEVLRTSGLDWTIVYATFLTNGPKTELRSFPRPRRSACRRESHARTWPRSFCKRRPTVSTAVATSSLPDDPGWTVRANQDQQVRGIQVLPRRRACRGNAPQPADPGLTWAGTRLSAAVQSLAPICRHSHDRSRPPELAHHANVLGEAHRLLANGCTLACQTFGG
jgi:putative NADH-flavin reductase